MLNSLLEISFTDLVDVGFVALLLWALIAWSRRVHANLALVGLAFLGLLYLIALQLDLKLTAWLFQGFFAILVILLVVVFQEDLRRLFEQIAVFGLRRRPARGLLGAMMEFPSTEWRARKWSTAAARKQAPVDAEWTPLPGPVRHGFTHFRLELDVLAGRVDNGDRGADGVWCPPDRFGDYALPTLMRKVAAHALTALDR